MDIVAELLSRGADPCITSRNEGWDALQWATNTPGSAVGDREGVIKLLEQTEPGAAQWWHFEEGSALSGGDASSDACSSLEQARELMRGKPHHLPDGRAMAYQYYAPAGRLYNKPIGHQGGSQWRSGSMNLFMYGRAVGHTCKGKTLIALDGVDVTRGDGKIEYNVKSYEQALAIVKRWADTNAAAFWHSPTSRMILKPKNNGARWTGKGIGGEGIGTLFMWADKPLLPGETNKASPVSGLARKYEPEEALFGGEGEGEGGRLVIHAARYGWASNLWDVPTGSGHRHGGGAKDVTDIVRRFVAGDELHVNPQRRGQYMNQHFWPETAGGPAIPRKLAVRYSYGVGGRQVTVETAAVPNETVSLDIVRPGGGEVVTSQPGGSGDDYPRQDGLIATDDIEGCWCYGDCQWFAIFHKRAQGPDALRYSICLLSPIFVGLRGAAHARSWHERI